MNLKSSTELRTSFVMNVVGMTLNNTAFILLWVFYSQVVGNVGGWEPIDVVGLQGFIALSLGVNLTFFGGLMQLPEYVLRGGFDQFLLSPKSVLMRVATSKMSLSAMGDVVFGVACLVLYGVLIGASMPQWGTLVFMTLLSTAIFFAVLTAIVSLSFLFPDSNSIVQGVFELFLTPSLYHGGSFQGVLRAVFMYVIPSLLIGSLPIENIRTFSGETTLLLCALTLFWYVVGLWAFHRGIRSYESANFMTFGGS